MLGQPTSRLADLPALSAVEEHWLDRFHLKGAAGAETIEGVGARRGNLDLEESRKSRVTRSHQSVVSPRAKPL